MFARAIGAMVLTLAGAAPAARAQCPDGTPPPCRSRATRPGAPAATSVAVLYFDNLSRDSTDAYLADGLTEEITARLGQLGRLTVASRTSVRRLRGSADTMSPTDLGRALNAAFLVNGTVRRAGPRLRVTVELLRAVSGVQAWSSQYDRSSDDLLDLQEEIAMAVAAGVAGQLLPGERARLASRPTASPAAYDLYLRGVHALGTVQGRESLQEAIAAFEAALLVDPGFTAARGSLAYAYGAAANWDYPIAGVPAESVVARGLEAADRALRADSLSADAWMGRGWLLFFRRPPDYPQSVAALQRAVLLDSGNALAHQGYASLLRRLGDYDASRAEYLRTASGVGRSQALSDLGFIAYSRRRYREALAWYDSALTADVSYTSWAFRARVRLAVGDTAGAQEDAQSAVRRAPVSARIRSLAIRAWIDAATGNPGAARAPLDAVLSNLAPGDGPVSVRLGWELAAALVAIGDSSRALALLERVEPRGAWLWSYLVFRDFDPIRGTQGFQRIYREAKPAGAPDPPAVP